jgi:hypothetical protein
MYVRTRFALHCKQAHTQGKITLSPSYTCCKNHTVHLSYWCWKEKTLMMQQNDTLLITYGQQISLYQRRKSPSLLFDLHKGRRTKNENLVLQVPKCRCLNQKTTHKRRFHCKGRTWKCKHSVRVTSYLVIQCRIAIFFNFHAYGCMFV